jgi:hypothetical protein
MFSHTVHEVVFSGFSSCLQKFLAQSQLEIHIVLVDCQITILGLIILYASPDLLTTYIMNLPKCIQTDEHKRCISTDNKWEHHRGTWIIIQTV